MNELVPGWVLREEESSSNHWVGSCRDVVMVFAYRGSHSDARHVACGARVVERVAREHVGGARVFFALPVHGSPPDASVRGSIVDAARRVHARTSRLAVVIAGEGFAAAIHRGAVTGIMSVVRPAMPVKVVSGPAEGLAFLLGDTSEVLSPLLRLCEQRLLGPSPTQG